MSEVILTQTDTTVGFLSQDEKKLYEIKSRKSLKPFLKVYASFYDLLNANNRVPDKFKNIIRRSKKTTFIVKNRAFRIAKPQLHSQILRDLKWHYSTSANESGKNFKRDFCEGKADIIIENKYGLHEHSSSSLVKLTQTKRRKLR